jgi:DNA-binding CsgD family transcriptional regulator
MMGEEWKAKAAAKDLKRKVQLLREKGLTNIEIADMLDIHEVTVRTILNVEGV